MSALCSVLHDPQPESLAGAYGVDVYGAIVVDTSRADVMRSGYRCCRDAAAQRPAVTATPGTGGKSGTTSAQSLVVCRDEVEAYAAWPGVWAWCCSACKVQVHTCATSHVVPVFGLGVVAVLDGRVRRGVCVRGRSQVWAGMMSVHVVVGSQAAPVVMRWPPTEGASSPAALICLPGISRGAGEGQWPALSPAQWMARPLPVGALAFQYRRRQGQTHDTAARVQCQMWRGLRRGHSTITCCSDPWSQRLGRTLHYGDNWLACRSVPVSFWHWLWLWCQVL